MGKNGLSILLYSIKDLKLHTRNRYYDYKTAINTRVPKLSVITKGFKISDKYQGFKIVGN